jgi:hypothetical protein
MIGIGRIAGASFNFLGSTLVLGVVAASSLTTRATSAHSATIKINTPMTINDISVGFSILWRTRLTHILSTKIETTDQPMTLSVNFLDLDNQRILSSFTSSVRPQTRPQ